MNKLDEVAAQAKREGAWTDKWGRLRNLYHTDNGTPSGAVDMEKIKAWADKEDLLMLFDYEFEDFSSGIRSVTLMPRHR